MATTRLPISRVGLLVLVLLSVIATGAGADPLTIDSGFYRCDADHCGISIVADGLLAAGVGGHFQNIFPSPAPGQVLTTTQTFNDRFVGTPFPATVDGVTYPRVHFELQNFAFTGGTFVASPGESVTPFTFMGTLNGYDVGAGQQDVGLLFSRDLVGQGHATVLIQPLTPNQLALDSFEYRFEAAAPAATPEPATIVLVGTAVAGIFRTQQRRRRSSVIKPQPS